METETLRVVFFSLVIIGIVAILWITKRCETKRGNDPVHPTITDATKKPRKVDNKFTRKN